MGRKKSVQRNFFEEKTKAHYKWQIICMPLGEETTNYVEADAFTIVDDRVVFYKDHPDYQEIIAAFRFWISVVKAEKIISKIAPIISSSGS